MGVQCLLTVESGFVHARIISGVSVPLGLGKPSLATINRSAGCKLMLAASSHRRQAGPLRHSRETGAVLSLSPLSPTRLHIPYAWECACSFPKTLCLITPSSVTRKVKSCSYPSVAGGLTNRGVFFPTAVSGKVIYIPLETQTSLSLPTKKAPGYKLVAVKRLEIILCCAEHYLLHLNSLYYC